MTRIAPSERVYSTLRGGMHGRLRTTTLAQWLVYVPPRLTLKLRISHTHGICVFCISLTINNHYILRQLPQTGLYKTSTASSVRYYLKRHVECIFLLVSKLLITNFRQHSNVHRTMHR